ncbi:PstC family ABC transporter permease [uncultured Photobacterium sp.]|uniref:PstC family ABC transporter permease n=1 Tax=uncultured Photobacterium sp. TaxID=173973 RepID=UPI002622AAE1|nr:ABC transporter permease subunit [uncultured Photobacterium sp.]
MTSPITTERILLVLVTTVFVLMLLLFGFLFWFALPVFINTETQVLSLNWMPEQGQYGILSMIIGSGLIGFIALTVAFPIAVGIAGFCLLNRYQKIAVWIRRVIRLMAGIPTVVYGIAAVFLLVPLLRETFRSGSGFCLLAAAMMVVLLILPVMVMMLDTHCRPQANQISLASASMGFTDTQTVLYLVLPNATKAMASAALLGFSRAIGDTLLPLMLTGNAPQLTDSVFDSIRTLTAHIGLVLATENGSAAYNSLFAAGLLLLAISVTVTLLIRKMEHAQCNALKGDSE